MESWDGWFTPLKEPLSKGSWGVGLKLFMRFWNKALSTLYVSWRYQFWFPWMATLQRCDDLPQVTSYDYDALLKNREIQPWNILQCKNDGDLLSWVPTKKPLIKESLNWETQFWVRRWAAWHCPDFGPLDAGGSYPAKWRIWGTELAATCFTVQKPAGVQMRKLRLTGDRMQLFVDGVMAPVSKQRLVKISCWAGEKKATHRIDHPDGKHKRVNYG